MNNSKIRSRKDKSGFTMIELLIVISIIAVLAGISIFALQGARESGRDAKRKADLEAIRGAMEIFKADCNQYPTNLNQLLSGPAAICAPSSNVYMQAIPIPPEGGNYNSNLTATTYQLCATLEGSNPASCTIGGNYGVRNP